MKKRFTRYEYEQANKVIRDMYDLYGYGLDIEECIDVSWMAFVEIRNAMGNISNTDMLWILAKRKIVNDLHELRKIRNAKYRLESRLSLNQVIGDSDEPVYTFLFSAQGDFANSVCMWHYIQSLGAEKEFILKKLYQGESDIDIMDMLHMEFDEYYEIKSQLKEDVLKYFEE